MRSLALLPVVLILVACVNMVQVGPGEVPLGDRMVATPGLAWNKLQAPGMGRVELWTRDGFPLDTIRFFMGIKEGEPLVEQRGAKDKQVAKFRSGMPDREIVEMFEAAAADAGTVKIDRVAPANFSGQPGIRFEFTLTRKGDEVVVRGFGYATVRDGELFMAVFQAPRIHYFAKHAEAAEAMLGSVRFKAAGKGG